MRGVVIIVLIGFTALAVTQAMGQPWLGPFGAELGSTARRAQQTHGTAGIWRDEQVLVFDEVEFQSFIGQVVYHIDPGNRVIVSMSFVVTQAEAVAPMEQLLTGLFGVPDERERLRTARTLLSYAFWQRLNGVWRLEQTLDGVMVLSLVAHDD